MTDLNLRQNPIQVGKGELLTRGRDGAILAYGVMVDKATVTKTDIVGSNGVIHVIDSVLMPM